MIGMRTALFFLLLPTLCAVAPAMAGQAEVKAFEARLYAEPNLKSKILATLKKGQAVETFETKGKFLRAKAVNGKVGFILAAQVSPRNSNNTAGASKGDDLGELLGSMADTRTASVEESSSTHSIRGLRKQGAKTSSGVTAAQAELYVRQMEKFSVTDAEFEAFLREGKVGAYAGK